MIPEQPEISGWKIDELIAVGGMGEIWLGKCGEIKAAIKVPSAKLAGDRPVLDRFEMEADILSGLKHPHVLEVVDIGETRDGRLFIATEYIEGSDLRRLLRAEKIGLERALDIFGKVSSAIEYAHGENVIHRDIKPTNILVAADGTVKVADFGLAKKQGVDSSLMRTSGGDGLGTPYYVAPESLRNAASADERADVYALGVLLYEMISGKVPLGAYASLSRVAGLSKGWDTLIRRALQEDPDDRFSSVGELRRSVAGLWNKHQNRSRAKRWQKLGVGVLLVGLAVFFGMWLERSEGVAKEKPMVYRSPLTATVDDPWQNSLGMELIPLPDNFSPQVLMSRTETSLGQYQVFREDEVLMIPEWRIDEDTGLRSRPVKIFGLNERGWWGTDASLENLGFPHGEDDPVGGLAATDCGFFCAWLTIRERSEGRIGARDYYRLPTFSEWKKAAESSRLEEANFAREESQTEIWPKNFNSWSGRDDFPYMAPVSGGTPNRDGFYHLYGNVYEWVIRSEDAKDKAGRMGGSWSSKPMMSAMPQHRGVNGFRVRQGDNGFRVVLVLQGEESE